MSSRSVAKAINIEDLRVIAKRRTPKALFDFVDGGSESETTLRDNRSQFDKWRLLGRNPINVEKRDHSVNLFGHRFELPFVIAPTGMASLMRGRAEVELARGAHQMGIPLILSTGSSVGIEDLARNAGGPLWFQLYILRDRAFTECMIERARDSGYTALVISVDCASLGQRERDVRNGLSLPVRPTLSNAVDLLRRPAWLIDFLRNGVPQPENFAGPGEGSGQSLIARMQNLLDPTVGWEDIAWVRERWSGPLLVKGLTSVADARAAVERGADGIVVSNQGGRQLDHAVPTIDALPYIVDAVGDRCTVLCDGGFRRGTDVAKALALGAKAAVLGRATLFGAAAGGQAGVVRALTIIRDELDRTMAFMGCRRIAEIDRGVLWDHERHAPAGIGADS